MIKENKNKSINDKRVRVLLIILYLLILSFIIILYFVIKPEMDSLISLISHKTREFVENNLFLAFLYVIFIEILFNVFYCPGLTFFNIAIGYLIDNLFTAFALVYVGSMLSSLLIYPISRYLFRDYLNRKFRHKWFYGLIQDESKEKPWKISWIIRIIFIPTPYKNYLIPIFEITFLQFAIPSLIFNIIYFGLMVLVGYNTKNFINIFSNSAFNWKNSSVAQKVLSIFFFFLMFVLWGFIVFVIRFTIKKYKEYKKKNDEKKELENIEDDPVFNKSNKISDNKTDYNQKENDLECPFYN